MPLIVCDLQQPRVLNGYIQGKSTRWHGLSVMKVTSQRPLRDIKDDMVSSILGDLRSFFGGDEM